MRLDLCFWKHANSEPFQAPSVTAAQFLPMVFVWAAYSAPRRICPRLKRRIFPGVIKRAYGQILAENNKQMLSSRIEANVDAVPREKLSIQLFIPIYPSPEGREWHRDWDTKAWPEAIYIAKKKTAEHIGDELQCRDNLITAWGIKSCRVLCKFYGSCNMANGQRLYITGTNSASTVVAVNGAVHAALCIFHQVLRPRAPTCQTYTWEELGDEPQPFPIIA